MSMMLNMEDVTETPRVADQIGYKDGKTVADKLDELTESLTSQRILAYDCDSLQSALTKYIDFNAIPRSSERTYTIGITDNDWWSVTLHKSEQADDSVTGIATPYSATNYGQFYRIFQQRGAASVFPFSQGAKAVSVDMFVARRDVVPSGQADAMSTFTIVFADGDCNAILTTNNEYFKTEVLANNVCRKTWKKAGKYTNIIVGQDNSWVTKSWWHWTGQNTAGYVGEVNFEQVMSDLSCNRLVSITIYYG